MPKALFEILAIDHCHCIGHIEPGINPINNHDMLPIYDISGLSSVAYSTDTPTPIKHLPPVFLVHGETEAARNAPITRPKHDKWWSRQGTVIVIRPGSSAARYERL